MIEYTVDDFPKLSEETRLARLMPPEGKVRFVLDTDAFNEMDDQFAIVYALLSQEKLDVEAIYAAPFSAETPRAAPFHRDRASGPADGMEKSYQEILRVLGKMNIAADGLAYRGSTSYLKNREKPEESEAVRDLIERALREGEGLLYVAGIGAVTNIASAILIEPRIIDRIVVICGGHPSNWHNACTYNLSQDIAASHLIYDCGVPLVRINSVGVSSHMTTSVHEIEEYVQGRGAIGDYLCEIFRDFHSRYCPEALTLWIADLADIAWLVNSKWIPSEITHSPILTDQMTWSHDWRRHLMRETKLLWRDPVFRDLYTKLDAFARE